MSRLSCSDIEALAAELVLGILPGDERADALSHLDGCPACQHHVEALALVADELLLAASEQDPPSGFDDRVVRRVAAEQRAALGRSAPPRSQGPAAGRAAGGAAGRARHRWRRPLAMAAAALVVVVAALGGVAAGRSGTGATTAQAAAVTVGTGRWICRVATFPGQGDRPTRLVIRLDEPADTDGSYTVEAEPASGAAPVPIGAISLVNGTGVLDVTVPNGTGKVRAIRVVGPDGALHYRASFPAV